MEPRCDVEPHGRRQRVLVVCGRRGQQAFSRGVPISPGDFIVADTIGVAVIPLAKAEEVVELAREQAEREQKTREWGAQGKTVEDLLKEFGRI